MKLYFFLVALCLVMLRAFFSFTGHGRHNDDNEGTMTVRINDYYEQIKWSGKAVLSEDETSIASIPPGGYLKFRENELKMVAESNLQGEIGYTLYDGHENLPLNDSGRHFITACLSKMIAWGYNAGGRAERINKKGGYHALIAELPRLKMENVKAPYLDLVLRNDSLREDELAAVIHQIASAVSDIDKENFLKRLTPVQLKDPAVSSAYLDIVSGINADLQKVNLLSRLIEQDSLTSVVFDRIMNISSHFNSDMDKQGIYHKLTDSRDLTEDELIALLDAAAQQHADVDKSNLLIYIAQKMPRTERTRTAYLGAAKKINNDADYGKAVKIIE